MSLQDINRTLQALEQLGLVEKTGEFRKGRPVCAVTAYSKHLDETAPELVELILRRGQTHGLTGSSRRPLSNRRFNR